MTNLLYLYGFVYFGLIRYQNSIVYSKPAKHIENIIFLCISASFVYGVLVVLFKKDPIIRLYAFLESCKK